MSSGPFPAAAASSSEITDLTSIPRPSLTPRVNLVLQLNWMAVAATFMRDPPSSDITDLLIAVLLTEVGLDFEVDSMKQIFCNYLWLHHRRFIRRKQFSLHLVYPHT